MKAVFLLTNSIFNIQIFTAVGLSAGAVSRFIAMEVV